MVNVELIKIRQIYQADKITDVVQTTYKELQKLINSSNLNLCGASIGIAVGSRGIANIVEIVKCVISFVRNCGGDPFIIPAMGSHGGATARGQEELLNEYGINEAEIGTPIHSSMDVIEVSDNSLENRLFMSRVAFESDGVILINRIKPHTDFQGLYESGLAKMSVIGLGKHAQALEIHKFGVRGLRELIPESARAIISTGKILFGLGIIENAYDQTIHIEAIASEQIMTREPVLLQLAKKNMPSLPVDHADILIIDKIGKDISGTGLDPNIIGRIAIRGEREPPRPNIKQIIVSDLSEKSHGNALGIGLADVTTRKLFNKIDFDAMYKNAYTSTFLERAKIPVIADSESDALRFALRACGGVCAKDARIIRISDTLHLDILYVSEVIFNELAEKETIERLSEALPLFSDNLMNPF